MSLTAFDSQVPREALSWLDQDALDRNWNQGKGPQWDFPRKSHRSRSGSSFGGSPPWTGMSKAPCFRKKQLLAGMPEHPCLRQETHRGPRAPTLTICPGISALSPRAQDDPRKRVSSVRTNLRIQTPRPAASMASSDARRNDAGGRRLDRPRRTRFFETWSYLWRY